MNPGNSGGTIVNNAGNVLGLVSSQAAVGSGIAFAVPIQNVLNLFGDLSSSAIGADAVGPASQSPAMPAVRAPGHR